MDVRKPLLKLILLGDSGVGKTSLIQQYVNKKFTIAYRKTVGADFTTKDVFVDDQVVTLQIWDTGQERFQSLGVPCYRGADCVILVHDVTSPTSCESLKGWQEEFAIKGSPNNPKKFPFVVLGNKIDQDNKGSCKDKIQGILKCDYEVPYFETSAKGNINVDSAFLMAAKLALEREREDELSSNIIFNHPENKNRERYKCQC